MPMQRAFLLVLACLALFAAGCGDDSSTSTSPSPAEETSSAEEGKGEEKAEAPELPQPKVPGGPPPKQLEIKDVKKGSGPTARAGDKVSVYYVGVVYKSKEQFDANWDSGEPFTFSLGAGDVIKGWDQGIQGMKVGGERELIIPPGLAYGNEGFFPSIPPNSTLVFLVKLLRVK
jgi:peptidylprolyl isomerase